MSPITFKNREWISAVVCGVNPPANLEYRLLQLSGLLHLIVVSGSHLVFVEQCLSIIFQKFKWKLALKIFVLTMFAFVTGFQAPVVRALFSHLLSHFQTSYKLFWKSQATTLFAGLVTLMAAPEWWKSLSLQLSWVAALALQSGFSGSRVKQQVTIFILMFPVLMQLAPPHPVSIIYNLVAAPFVGLVMFPISAASMFVPKQLWFVDDLWTWFFKTLEVTLPVSNSADPIKFGSVYLVWVYVFAVNIFLILRVPQK